MANEETLRPMVAAPVKRKPATYPLTGDQRKDITSALAAARQSGHAILPIALGERAALASADHAISIRQVMWSAADLISLVESAFPAAELGPAFPLAYAAPG